MRMQVRCLARIGRSIAMSIASVACLSTLPANVSAGPLDVATGERIVFTFGNSPDLAGMFDVARAFSAACLRQKWSDDLPERLRPEGYTVVTRPAYWWGKDEPDLPRTAVLSRTGREDDDRINGYPVIEMMPPTEKDPDGSCSVHWKRNWGSYEQNERRLLKVDMAAVMPSHVSYWFEAILRTKPSPAFRDEERYAGFDAWLTLCGEALCSFDVNWRFDNDGVDVTFNQTGSTPTSVGGDETKGRSP